MTASMVHSAHTTGPRARHILPLATGLLIATSAVLAASAGPDTPPSTADTIPTTRTDLTPTDRGRVEAVTRPTTDFTKPERFERMSGGAATSTASVGINSFSDFSANLSFEGERDFKLGNGLFKKLWVPAPSSTQASDGLGPLYNARSCQRCHLKDGRGHPPSSADDAATSMFLRLSVPPKTDVDREALASRALLSIPEPTYGGQLQDFAAPGIPIEGHMRIDYTDVPVELAGGETVVLRAPSYSVTDLGYGPMDPDVLLSPRVAPPMIGLGLLEAIHPADILAHADPDDADGDGISGKPSLVRDPETGEMTLGRFGWKASMPDVRTQSANAFSGDIGISTPEVPDPYGDCTENQTACKTLPTGVQSRLGATEAPDPVMDLVAFYSRNLAVPARRDIDDPRVLAGKKLFYEAGCASCHVPKYVTRRDADQAELRFQLIWPYTDMLLHDMGDGLADGRPVGEANGREWRTAPLWGIGLTEAVSGHSLFLHDGRARNLTEAILWHGGEAKASRDAFAALAPHERADLIAFLKSL
ncbi:CxxC motif-containing protein (DUF1111 family) [Amorphus suaedae]